METTDLETFLTSKNLKSKSLFFKIDIEGGEYALIPSIKNLLKECDTSLCIALHPEFLIESIRNELSGSFKELKVRWRFYKKHKNLIMSLPYSTIEHADGRSINLRKNLLKAFLLGKFPHALVAY